MSSTHFNMQRHRSWKTQVSGGAVISDGGAYQVGFFEVIPHILSGMRLRVGPFLHSMFRSRIHLLLAIGLVALLWQVVILRAQTRGTPPLRGTVVLPDGRPAVGATVVAKAACQNPLGGVVSMGFVKKTVTAGDGTFSFWPFDPDCNRYSFSASKQEDYWLPSDQRLFTDVEPSIPAMDLASLSAVKPIRITLGARGGRIAIRVWDIATARFVHAGLELSRKPVAGKSFQGPELTSTGKDGAALVELFPLGEYEVQVRTYPCGKNEYWASNPRPVSSFAVESAIQLEKTIRIDVRNIKPEASGGRPQSNCKP